MLTRHQHFEQMPNILGSTATDVQAAKNGRRTTPISRGWITFTRSLGTILPGADATMSIVPTNAQASAALNMKIIQPPTARPTGDGGVSTISNAAGRNARVPLAGKRCLEPTFRGFW
jgi:hypothetical protein